MWERIVLKDTRIVFRDRDGRAVATCDDSAYFRDFTVAGLVASGARGTVDVGGRRLEDVTAAIEEFRYESLRLAGGTSD